MSDPQPSPLTFSDGAGAPGEDARIEPLLVAGLDHYFAGRFDAAIHVWTRVLFLDRHHDRARAYIERARSAQAERHRQGDRLLHEGFDAFDRGDVEAARRLMGQALDLGASDEAALGMLGRIERLGGGARAGSTVAARLAAPGHRPVVPAGNVSGRERSRWWRRLPGVLVAVALAATLWGLAAGTAWQWPLARATAADHQPMSAIPETLGTLPVPSVSEAYIRQGQMLFDRGSLRDALAAFDRVPPGDPMRAEADRMRARIQRELMAIALARGPMPARQEAASETRQPRE